MIQTDYELTPEEALPGVNSEILTPLFIETLERSGLSRQEVDNYLSSQGLDADQIQTLHNQQIIYRVKLEDYAKLEDDLLLESIKDKNYNLSVKLLDMKNKKSGAYQTKMDITSQSEPINIVFK